MSEREVHQLRPDVYHDDGTMSAPTCACGAKMVDDGGCSEGCCDDWKCPKCGKRVRTEAPD